MFDSNSKKFKNKKENKIKKYAKRQATIQSSQIGLYQMVKGK